MRTVKNVLAICGSTRKTSTNSRLIRAIAAMSGDRFALTGFDGLDRIPHFNPDLDGPDSPTDVVAFRQKLRAADGVLICTPEYAMGVPGTLKNAIDWTVSSADFSGRPVSLITASSMGQKGHAALLETLKVIEARLSEKTSLLIPFAGTKVSAANTITDHLTRSQVEDLIVAFAAMLDSPAE